MTNRYATSVLKAWRRGHPIVKHRDGRWRWAATGRFVKLGANPNDPPCFLCNERPTPEGFDPCIGLVADAVSVCCGHGVVCGHVKYPEHPRISLPRLSDPPGQSYRFPIPEPSAPDRAS